MCLDGSEVQPEPRPDTHEGGSILAPFRTAIDVPISGRVFASAVADACKNIPHVGLERKRVVGRKAVPTTHTREVVCLTNSNGRGYPVVARCIERAHDEAPSDAVGRWVWEVGFLELPREGNGAAGAPGKRADVIRFKVRAQQVVGAEQLMRLRRNLMFTRRGVNAA